MIENSKSIMMDHVMLEFNDIVNSLIVKKKYMADRYETDETTQSANEYIAAKLKMDTFYSYAHYSDYALIKAGLTEREYQVDKTKIPMHLRDAVVEYQREYIIATYNEPNNYYRTLAGLPDIGDTPIYIDRNIDGVDESKPIHEMSFDEITILIVTGELDKLKKLYPEKKYLDHLDKDRKIEIHVARRTLDFDILYIKRDRTKQGVSDMFIGLYRQIRTYVLDKFYDNAYKYKSPYYDAFIGIFILCITIQRYITNYFHKFINRDFFNKDIIRLLFESYGLPFYNEIPLSYLQKTAKNLNRLLYYKATDRVFVDIFKIFDLDNINIYNYVLFKDRLLDNNNNPIEIYREVTDLGYSVDTTTYELTDNDNLYGITTSNMDNIKTIHEINGCEVYLQNNGTIKFRGLNTNAFTNPLSIKNDSEYNAYIFQDNFNITEVIELYGKTNKKLLFMTNKPTEFYIFDNISFESRSVPTTIDDKTVTDFFIQRDTTNDDCYVVGIELDNKICNIYLKGEYGSFLFTDYSLAHTLETGISDIEIYDRSVIIVDNLGVPFVFGNNLNYRLHLKDTFVNYFTSLENKLFTVKETHIFPTGTVFIMLDGTVRYTGSIPEIGMTTVTSPSEHNLTENQNIKTLITIYDGIKYFYMLVHYNNSVDIYNYHYSDRFGQLLYKDDIINPVCEFRFFKNINLCNDKLFVTVYKTDSFINYAGANDDKRFPFIRSMSILTEENINHIKHVELFNNSMVFSSSVDNNIRIYDKNNYSYGVILDQFDQIQDLTQCNDKLIVLVGKKYFYTIDTTYTSEKIIPGVPDSITNVYYNPIEGFYYILTEKNNIYKYDKLNNNSTLVDHYNVEFKSDRYEVSIRPTIVDNVLKFFIYFNDKLENKMILSKEIYNLYNCRRITVSMNSIVVIEGSYIQYLKISEILSASSTVEAYYHDEINKVRRSSDRVDDKLVVYNKAGGITVLKDFPHADKLDSYIEGEFISLYDDNNSFISDINFNDEDIMFITEKNNIVTFEPVVEKMYNLKFIEVPMDSKNIAEQFANSANYLDYELVVNDDKLWGGDGDKQAFINEVLNSEFNYVTSKYISVNCRYNLNQLNFEICYMFRMLTELKDNEKYMEFDVPYVGKVKLFDCIVGIYALTCLKFGFEGYILDTTTKNMSVLGFNFQQDMPYLEKVIADAKLYERDPNFKEKDIEIFKAPKLFANASEIINLYLNNIDIVQNIYDYKYNAKTIQEYNAYKKIQEATVYTKYTTDMYRLEDGSLPPTIMDYLKVANPNLWIFINETDDENMIEQIDNLLVALDTFMATDKFKFLFLNIPTLSLDNIRKFIYYLVDIFKSYTVDLKAMNIIYHVDDKRIHNIKLVLDEKNFYKYFEDYSTICFEDFMEYILGHFELYDKLKIDIKDEPNGKFTYEELMRLFKAFDITLIKNDEQREAIFSDFADIFDVMDEIFGIKKSLEITEDAIRESMLPAIMKLEFKKDITLGMALFKKDLLELIEKEYRMSNILRNDKLAIALKDKLVSSYHKVLPYKLILKLNKIISTSRNNTERDIVPFDFGDHMNYNGKMIQQNNKISIKDTIYFIRKDV